MTTTTKKTVRHDLVERAIAHMKAYRQYDGHFDDYKLGVVLKTCVGKMGLSFAKNQIVIYNPRVDMLPLSHERFHDVWSTSNKIDTVVDVKYVREIADRRLSLYQEMIMKLTDCDAVEAMIVEGYMRDTYHTLDNIDRATFNRAAKKYLKEAKQDPDTAALSLHTTPIPIEDDEAQLLIEREISIVDIFKRTSDAYDIASKAIENHFLPLIHAAIEKNDIEGARKIQKRMPTECVPCVFALDMIRQAEIKLGIRTEAANLSPVNA
jgi:hypothetical protein